MDPATVSVVSVILSSIDWKAFGKAVATDAASKGGKALLAHIGGADREKAAKKAIELFVTEFLTELEDKTPLSSSLPGYQDELKRLIECAAPDIIVWMQPDTAEVDLSPVHRMWDGLGLATLPEGFDWALVAKNYGRAIRLYVKGDSALRGMLDTALRERQLHLQEQSVEILARIAPDQVDFDPAGYQKYLKQKCGAVRLSSIDGVTISHRPLDLLSIFVPQSARETLATPNISQQLVRQLRQDGQISGDAAELDFTEQRRNYEGTTITPVLEILAKKQLVVVLGGPGSGKTSLLKFMALRWAQHESGDRDTGTLPVWIELKDYVRERTGLIDYFEAGLTAYGMSAREVKKRLRDGAATVYLDALDEIFDGPTRRSVIEEIAAFSARYDHASIVVT